MEARLHHINKNIEKKKGDVLKYKGHNCDNTVRYCCDLQKKGEIKSQSKDIMSKCKIHSHN